MNVLRPLDYTAIVIYMLLMAGIGLFLGKFVKNIGDYFKGGNAIPWVSGAISNFMTKFSTFIFVAYAGIAYQDGIVALTVIWSTVLPALLGVLFFAKRWRRAGVITVDNFVELLDAAEVLDRIRHFQGSTVAIVTNGGGAGVLALDALQSTGLIPAVLGEETIATLEGALSASDYVAGDAFTAADVYVGSHLGFGMQFGTIEKRPAFESYWQRVSAREAAIRANAIDDALVR